MKIVKNDIWVISPQGQDQNYNLSKLNLGLKQVMVKEYEISSIAKYLLNPHSHKAKRKMVGCTIHYNPKSIISKSAREKLPKTLQNIVNKLFPGKPFKPKIMIDSSGKIDIPEDFDDNLKANAETITEILRPYKPFNSTLNKIDLSAISHLTGIFESGDVLKQFNLTGTLLDQINDVKDNISTDINLFLPAAQRVKGSFDLSELNLNLYDPRERYRLLCFDYNSAPMACVLDSEKRIQYLIKDTDSIRLMHMFDLAIMLHPVFKDQMEAYVKGMAQPQVLSFSDDLKMAWDENHLPMFYEKVCSKFDIAADDKKEISKMLNYSTFTSIGMLSSLKNDSFLSSVSFHDFEYLRPMEKGLPSLYHAIKHNTHDIAGKKMYLLDVIEGKI